MLPNVDWFFSAGSAMRQWLRVRVSPVFGLKPDDKARVISNYTTYVDGRQTKHQNKFDHLLMLSQMEVKDNDHAMKISSTLYTRPKMICTVPLTIYVLQYLPLFLVPFYKAICTPIKPIYIFQPPYNPESICGSRFPPE